MKKMITLCFIAASAVSISQQASAAQSKVEWFEPEHYVDVRAANQNRISYRKQVFRAFEKHIAKRAEKLPSDHTLVMKFTDVDLAGDVRYMVGPNNSDIRVIKDIYIPRLKFEYKLLDSNDKVVKEASENIKDMGFFSNSTKRRNSDSFHYEKELLDDWFKDAFPEYF